MSTALTTTQQQQSLVGLQQTIDWKDPELKALIKNTVAKGASDNELAYFCLLANSKRLNPLNKEIYFSAYGEGAGRKSFVMIGRHGMLTLAERHPEFEGLSSCEIRAKDEFSFNPITGEITHVIKLPKSEIIGGWATARRKGRPPVTIVCWMDEYIKEKSEAWQKYKQDMIKFKAEKRVLEQLFKAEYQGLTVGDDYENVEPLPFSETYGPAVGALTMDDYLGDDKPLSSQPPEQLEELEQGEAVSIKDLQVLWTKVSKAGLAKEYVMDEFVKNNLVDKDPETGDFSSKTMLKKNLALATNIVEVLIEQSQTVNDAALA